MPIYEYVCKECNHKFEILHRGSGRMVVECSKCNSKEVQKLLSVFGFSSGGRFVSSGSDEASCGSCGSRTCGSCGK